MNIYVTKFNMKLECLCDENAYRLLIITFNVCRFFYSHVYNIEEAIHHILMLTIIDIVMSSISMKLMITIFCFEVFQSMNSSNNLKQ